MGNAEAAVKVTLDPRFNRTGDVWHVLVHGLDAPVHYGFRMERVPQTSVLDRYDANHVLLDPYARAVSVALPNDPLSGKQRRSVTVNNDFSWESDQPLNWPLAESVIYELHIRGFTRHVSAGFEHPGKFAGLVEKIPYLKDLGVTARLSCFRSPILTKTTASALTR